MGAIARIFDAQVMTLVMTLKGALYHMYFIAQFQ